RQGGQGGREGGRGGGREGPPPGASFPASRARGPAAGGSTPVGGRKAGSVELLGGGQVDAATVEVALHQLNDLPRVLHLEDRPDAAGVILSREQTGLQEGVVLGDDTVAGAEALRQLR